MRNAVASSWLLVGAALAAAWVMVAPDTARACGGFFCNGGGGAPGGGPTPVVQAAERVIFEQQDDGTVRAYVHIQYNQNGGAPVGFSWVIPVTNVPEIGVAEASTFNELDRATAPQFRFVNRSGPVSSGGGSSSAGCGSSDAGRPASGGAVDGGMAEVEGVDVWDSSRVGDYETAVIEGDSSDRLLEWLNRNGYDIPELARDKIDQYVEEDYLFAAFRYSPIESGTGNLAPVLLTYEGQPCVPIRITAIASAPILDIMVLAFGDRRATTKGPYYPEVRPDYQQIRRDPTAPTRTTYRDEVDEAIEDAGGRAFVIEHAAPTEELRGLDDLEARAIQDRNDYVTRFYTRMKPENMTVDPIFTYDGGEDVSRLHVIDLSQSSGTMSAAGSGSGEVRYAFPGAVALSLLALVWRRRR